MVSRRSSHGGEEDGNLHLSFSNSLREIERWRSKKKGQENPRAGTLYALKEKLQERGRRKRTPPYIENKGGSHNLTN